DAIVITQNDITKAGTSGIDELFSTELFSGFFGVKKNLVAGGRYRPLSVVTFAIEWQLFGHGYTLSEFSHNLLDDSFDKLRKQNLPADIVNKLKDIRNKNYETRDKFEKAIEKTIGADSTTRYKDEIISSSRNAYGNPWISHFINIILFALTCILLFNILSKLMVNLQSKQWYLSVPFIATLFFVVHPLHTEVVSNIKGRDEIFTLLGALLTLWFSLRFVETSKTRYLIYSAIAYFLALISKENAITFFVIIPAAILLFTPYKISKNLLCLVPLIIATGIFFLIRTSILGLESGSIPNELMNNSFLYHSPTEKFLSISYTLGLYLFKLLFPVNLTFDYYPYQIPIIGWKHPYSIWAVVGLFSNLLLFLFAIIIIIKRLKERIINQNKEEKNFPGGKKFNTEMTNILSFALFFYFASFSIVSNIFFPIGTFMSERFMYIPSIGFCLILTWLIIRGISKIIKIEKIAAVIIVIITIPLLLFYSIRTVSRNKDWQNDYTLFSSDVIVSGTSAKSNTSAGGKMMEEAEILKDVLKRKYSSTDEIAKILYDTTNFKNSEIEELLSVNDSAEIKKKISAKIENLYQSSFTYLKKAIEIHPTYTDALLLLGNAHYQYNKNAVEAAKYYKRILNQNKDYEKAYTNIDIIFSGYKDIPTKIKIYEDFYNINPERYDLNYRLGLLYGETKIDVNKAISFLEKAVKIKPDAFEAFKALGAGYGEKQNYDKAIFYTQKALLLKPDDVQVKTNLGISYILQGIYEFNNTKNYSKAIESFLLAEKYVKPDPSIYLNISQCYNMLGKPKEAAEYAQKAKI
ncbi:MAG: hypothetical protein HY738_16880, partial [Bacteroidia bacterium]|nr:hypothetical protein [Bacteroidia bacterium]